MGCYNYIQSREVNSGVQGWLQAFDKDIT